MNDTLGHTTLGSMLVNEGRRYRLCSSQHGRKFDLEKTDSDFSLCRECRADHYHEKHNSRKHRK